MASISKIRGINTRIRRKGISDYATQNLIFNAYKLGAVTPSGYLSKSKAILEDDLFTSLIENYQQEYKEQELMGEDKYIFKETMDALLDQYVQPSEYYQTMRHSSNAKDFAETIIDYINTKETFEDEDLKKGFIEWLKEDYAVNGKNAEKVFK